MARVLPTPFAEQWSDKPDELAVRAAELAPTIISEVLSGGGQDYLPFAGQSVGLIHDIRPARDIIRDTIVEAEQILRSLALEPILTF